MDTQKPLKILCVDISLIFSAMREANEGREDSEAFNRTIANVTSARAGFDRCMLAIDSGPSFRKVCAEYKANRKPRDAAYHDQLRRVTERLTADGCVPVVAPKIGTFPVSGADSFAEADDVIGWAAKQFELHIDDMTGAEKAGWHFAILSDDGDMEQLICDAANVYVIKSALRGGEVWNESKVTEKHGVPPEKIADLKALMGDKSDNYKGYTGPKKDIDPAKPDVDPGFNPGVGEVIAAKLVNLYGSALGIFDVVPPEELAARWEADGVKPGVRATLARHGRGVAERGLFLATIHRDLPGLDFSVVLAEPTVKKIDARPPRFAAEPAKIPDAVFEPVPAPSSAPAVDAPQQSTALAARTIGAPIDIYGLQPRSLAEVEGLAKIVIDSRAYAFTNIDQVVMLVIESRERGVPVGAALRAAYNVNGKLAWSASYLAALVLSSGKANHFEIVESTSTQATVAYQRIGRPAGTFTFTLEEARIAGWIKGGSKWATNPRTMLRWAALREAARAFFADVVSGMYTPDEIGGDVRPAEFEAEEAA